MPKYFKCITNKLPLDYRCGENIEFTVFVKENDKYINDIRINWELTGDDGGRVSGTDFIKAESPLKIEYSLNKPGFVHLFCEAVDDNGDKLKCFDNLDASAGADIEKLQYMDTLPDDFDDYWKEIEDQISDFPLEIVGFKEETEDLKTRFKAFDVKIKTPFGRPASMRVTIPIGNKKYPLRLAFLGYGITPAYYEYIDDTICACINAHGIENDKSAEELLKKYNVEGQLLSYGFDIQENKSKINNYWRGMAIRNLMALKYLKTLPEWNGKEIISLGGSQGALQAITVGAHDKDVTRVEAYIPWFCNLKSVEYGFISGWRPKFAEGLRYFDTVAQGMKLKCPIKICARLGDYVCPPSGVMALYNSIKSEKKITFMQSGTHSYIPPEYEEFVYDDKGE